MFHSYLWLLVMSFILSGRPRSQELVAVVWLFVAGYVVWAGSQQTHLRPKQGRFIWMAQVPGMLAVLVSVISQVTGRLGEWGDGVLEVWVHPFMPFLELLPPTDWGHWSDVYLVSCVLPFAFTLLGTISFRVLAKQAQSVSPDVYPRK